LRQALGIAESDAVAAALSRSGERFGLAPQRKRRNRREPKLKYRAIPQRKPQDVRWPQGASTRRSAPGNSTKWRRDRARSAQSNVIAVERAAVLLWEIAP